jgi:multidrug resistance efflux pump
MGTVDNRGGILELWPENFPQSGQVRKVRFNEGQEVKAGDVLVEFDDVLAKAQLEKAKAAVAQAEAEVKRYQAEREQARRAVEGQKDLAARQAAAVAAKEAELERAKFRFEQLLKAVENRQMQKLDQQAEEQGLRALEKGLEAERLLLKSLETTALAGVNAKLESANAAVQGATAAVAVHAADVQSAEKALSMTKLTAKTDGRVERVYAREGQMVGPQTREPLMLFVPKGDLIVRAEVVQEFANRLADVQGKPVTIQDHYNPDLAYRGTVEKVGGAFLRKRTVTGAPDPFATGGDGNVLEVLIKVDPSAGVYQPPLRIGQQVRVVFP